MPDFRDESYADCALAIDCGQTISQPYMVALMTEALKLSGRERVLEIGTGSGYQTAILAELARQVVSIERYRELSERAGALLGQLGYGNVTLIVGDGTLGWPEQAPYDRILVTAAAEHVPEPLLGAIGRGGNPGRAHWGPGRADVASDSPAGRRTGGGQSFRLSICSLGGGRGVAWVAGEFSLSGRVQWR